MSKKDKNNKLKTFNNTPQGRRNLVIGKIYKIDFKGYTVDGIQSHIAIYEGIEEAYGQKYSLFKCISSTISDQPPGSKISWNYNNDGETFTKLD